MFANTKWALPARFALASAVVATGLIATTASNRANATTEVEFTYTGAVQSFTVPANVISIQVTAQAANGHNLFNNGDAALGAQVSAKFQVTAGDELDIYVGGTGTSTAGGFNGGGDVADGAFSGGGGGATDIRPDGGALADRLLVAGGGGGARSTSQSLGGSGGTPDGDAGETGVNGPCDYDGGAGGTTAGGGAGGTFSGDCTGNWTNGQSGVLGVGGDGGGYGAGGGGGYYGGGGGSGFEGGAGAGGGGGSSFIDEDATNTSYGLKSDAAQDDGKLTITYTPAATVSFNSNGGSGSMSAQIADSATALTTNGFSRSGYDFAGWNTAANGAGTDYTNGATYPFAQSTTLYAQWTQSLVAPGKVTGTKVKVKKRNSKKKRVILRWQIPDSADEVQFRVKGKKAKKYSAWRTVEKSKFKLRLPKGKYKAKFRATNDAGTGPTSTLKFRVR